MKLHPDECRGVWVFVETWEGKIARVSMELIGKGRELADKLGVELSAVLLGESVEQLAEVLIHNGADRVLLADDPALKHYTTDAYTRILAQQVPGRKAGSVDRRGHPSGA